MRKENRIQNCEALGLNEPLIESRVIVLSSIK